MPRRDQTPNLRSEILSYFALASPCLLGMLYSCRAWQHSRFSQQPAGERPANGAWPMTPQEKQELANTPPAWMYEFDLGDGIKTPLLAEELRSIHQTRQQMILPLIDRLYPAGLVGIKCLDVACNEGYFSHLLYHRGATVRGTDIRRMQYSTGSSCSGDTRLRSAPAYLCIRKLP